MSDAANSALFALIFLESCALVFLLVVYALLARQFSPRYFRLWIGGWAAWTICGIVHLFPVGSDPKLPQLAIEELYFSGMLFLLATVLEYTGRKNRLFLLRPFGFLVAGCAAVFVGFGYHSNGAFHAIAWIDCAVCIAAGWMLWNSPRAGKGWVASLTAVVILLLGLHGIDRLDWPTQEFWTVRLALDALLELAVGMSMALLVVDTQRARAEIQSEKMRGMGIIIAAASESRRVERALQEVLSPLLECVGASRGVAYLLEPSSENPAIVLRASVGFSGRFLAAHYRLPASASSVSKVLGQGSAYFPGPMNSDTEIRLWAEAEKLSSLALIPLPGVVRPIGLLGIGSEEPLLLGREDLEFLRRVASLLSTTIQNVRRLEEAADAHQLWTDTFDSMSDLILVHGADYRILRVNRALADRLFKTPASLEGLPIREVLQRDAREWKNCPYCEENDHDSPVTDPTFGGRLLVSTSNLENSTGVQHGVIHHLRNSAARQESNDKLRMLFENMQEGVFTSTPSGRFLDFNQAFQRMLGYESREELLKVDIAQTLYAQPAERERLKRILHEHGEVTDFEFQFRRRDGEIRTASESSFAVRNESKEVVAYQGFLLDVTDRRAAELELRRRNHELMVLNAIAEMLSGSADLKGGLGRALLKIVELFGADLGAIYLLDERNGLLTRVAATGYRSEYGQRFPAMKLSQEGPLLKMIKRTRATLLSATGLPLPEAFRDVQRKEGILAAPLVILWSKDKIMGALTVGSRSVREFSPPELNLLAAVASQLAVTIDKSLLHEETLRAYENLRRAQEQLLQSEKMAAVGQLISGVAHELNNPLTAILGYSQLLRAEELLSQRGSEYVEKLSKQAQRTHHIVQNLLSFARQHKPERRSLQLTKILEDTLFLCEYDLKMRNISVHREFHPNLPAASGDFHQLQQVFLNILNNALDAVLESQRPREIWICTSATDKCLKVEFIDNGPGVQDARRVFDPFYTTKPVGKGTGLGLSICYGIVKEHGGEILVRNAPPRGASFTVILPMAQTSSTNPVETPAEGTPARGCILLVESQEAVLQVEQDILSRRGLKVETVRSGREALQYLEKGSVDGVVVDVQIPGEISGWRLYRWIEGHRPELAGRVVFTFSSAREEEAQVLVGNSGCPALQKPFEVEEFWGAIRKILSSSTAAPVKG